MSSKEELERLKKQLRDEEEKLKLVEEIRVIRARLDKKQGQFSLKAWLKKRDYWYSFILGVVGIGLAELGILLNIYFPGIIGGIIIWFVYVWNIKRRRVRFCASEPLLRAGFLYWFNI